MSVSYIDRPTNASPLWMSGVNSDAEAVRHVAEATKKQRRRDQADRVAAIRQRIEDQVVLLADSRELLAPALLKVITDVAMLAVRDDGSIVPLTEQGIVSAGIQVRPEAVDDVLAATGTSPVRQARYGECETCVFAYRGQSRGWGAPCVGCAGLTLDQHMTEEELAEALAAERET